MRSSPTSPLSVQLFQIILRCRPALARSFATSDMKNLRPWLFAVLMTMLVTRSSGADLIHIGASRADVITQFGEPAGQVNMGSKEILTYPEGRIILEYGRVKGSETTTTVVAPVAAKSSSANAPREKLRSAAPGWINNFEEAKKQAMAQDKPILYLLTGNMDRCPWGKQFNASIQTGDGFVRKASPEFVLLRISMSEIKAPDGNVTLEELKRWEFEMNEFARLRKEIFATDIVPSLAVLSPDASQSVEVDMSRAQQAKDMLAYTWAAVLAAKEAPKKPVAKATAIGSRKLNFVYIGIAIVVIGLIAKRLKG